MNAKQMKVRSSLKGRMNQDGINMVDLMMLGGVKILITTGSLVACFVGALRIYACSGVEPSRMSFKGSVSEGVPL